MEVARIVRPNLLIPNLRGQVALRSLSAGPSRLGLLSPGQVGGRCGPSGLYREAGVRAGEPMRGMILLKPGRGWGCVWVGGLYRDERALPEAMLGKGLYHQVQDRYGGRIGPGRPSQSTSQPGHNGRAL